MNNVNFYRKKIEKFKSKKRKQYNIIYTFSLIHIINKYNYQFNKS